MKYAKIKQLRNNICHVLRCPHTTKTCYHQFFVHRELASFNPWIKPKIKHIFIKETIKILEKPTKVDALG